MRKKWFIPLLSGILLLTAVSSTFGVDTKYKASLQERVWPASRCRGFSEPFRHKFFPWHRRYWRDFRLDFDRETRHLYRQLRRKERELRRLLRESYPDPTEIHMLIDEIASICAEIQKKIVDIHLGLREKLDRRGWAWFPPLYGYWWYGGEDCPFSPFE